MTKEIDYVELLKLAHEKLGSQSDMIAELEKKLSLRAKRINAAIGILYKAGKCDADCLEYFEALKEQE
jgi:hypothetical protein